MRKVLTTILAMALLIVAMGTITTHSLAYSSSGNGIRVINPTPSGPVGTTSYRVQDLAEVMPGDLTYQLNTAVDNIVNQFKMDIVILTVKSMSEYGYTDIEAFADDWYDKGGYGIGDDYSGMIFVAAMEEREWAISTCGEAIKCYTDAAQEYIMEYVKPYLSDGDYYGAFMTLTTLCAPCMNAYRNGETFPPKDPYKPTTAIMWFIIVGLIAALIYTGILKKQLKSVAFAPNADCYVDKDSVDVNIQKDNFLYATVTKTVRESKSSSGSSTHTSSSGRSHGGSHGSF